MMAGIVAAVAIVAGMFAQRGPSVPLLGPRMRRIVRRMLKTREVA